MVFTSYSFILLFLPLTVGFFYVFKSRTELQKSVLVIASLCFVASGGLASVTVIVGSLLVNYLASRATPPQRVSKRIAFGILAALNVAVLVAFKYFVSKVYFPLGLSFYTFSQLLYLKSVLFDDKPASSLGEYLVWILFFGKITQGPIVGYDDISVISVGSSNINWDLLADGIVLFILGMAKKLLLADNLAVIVDNSWEVVDLGLIPAWIGSLAYTFQLYFDFSGYTDMARGIGLMFGMTLPRNFDSPYKSSSISEFWRRWHITLGKALTMLVYIPLGGSRRGKARTCINLLIVMLVSGIWHGDTWTFVFWGLANGLFMIAERLLGFDKKVSRIHVVLTFVITNFLWVLFRSPGLDAALARFGSMFDFTNIGLGQVASLAQDGVINFPSIIWLAYVGFLLVISFVICFGCRNSDEVAVNVKGRMGMLVLIPLLFLMCFASIGRASVFLYQNF